MGPVGWAVVSLALAVPVLVVSGVQLTRTADVLADRTGMGEALAGALLLGAVTSAPGIVTTTASAAAGEGSLAVANAIGSISVQTAFLVVADLVYRRANLEHAAASVPNLIQSAMVVVLLGLVVVATLAPDWTVAAVNPLSLVIVATYFYGLHLSRSQQARPMWRAAQTDETREDVPDEDDDGTPMRSLWLRFGAFAVVVTATGALIARSGVVLAEQTGLTGGFVGTIVTGVVTSGPEIVTLMAAVRVGALTLGVGEIIGGNAFDVLFIPAADVAFRDGSVYQAIGPDTRFMAGVAVLLAALVTAGLVHRQRRGIGFEGLAVMVVYLGGLAVVAFGF